MIGDSEDELNELVWPHAFYAAEILPGSDALRFFMRRSWIGANWKGAAI